MNLQKSGLWRILALGLCIGLALIVYMFRLAQIQIADGASYLAAQQAGDVKVQTREAARGEIVDRNGSPFAYNEASYRIVFDKALMPAGRENETILTLIGILSESGEEWISNLPLQLNETGKVVFAPDSDNAVTRLKNFVGTNSYASASDILYWLRDRYSLEDYTDAEAVMASAVRYEMERTGYSIENRYIFAEDISLDTATLISQLQSSIPGAYIEETANRVYIDGDLAPHIIGRTGAIVADQVDEYLAKGYSMNDRVGVEGIERAYEDILRGESGEILISRAADYSVTGVEESKPAVPGDTVMLTIDKNIQRVALNALRDEIAYLNEYAKEGEGKEADAGAAVVIDIKNSELLAAVTYPSYDLSTYSQDFAKNSADPLMPFWNRAFAGVYAPGSTFKPTVAIAGLAEDILTARTQVRCSKVYTYFEDYQPTCLGSHGLMTLADALRASCNIFFYDTGRNLGIQTINNYAQSLGLGVPTGIELYEAAGTQCDPDSPNPGDSLQAAIGQLDNGYTPLQLANYAATIARRGIRTDLSLVKAICSYYDYNEVIEENEPSVMANVLLEDKYWDAVFDGMIQATHAPNGTSYRYLGDYPITVASKTGTPQTQQFPNSTYICFAPAEDPQIAIAVVIEKGWHGYTGAPVARAILDAYFYPDGNPVDLAKAQAAADKAAEAAQNAEA